MTSNARVAPPSHDRMLLVALAACCVLPMLVIVVLTAVLGVAFGPAVAVSLGLVAAFVCVAVMYQHHRGRGHDSSVTGQG